MAKVVVVGAGMMGTALCTPIADAGHEVALVGTPLDREWIAAMQKQRCHPKLGVSLPDRVRPFFVEDIADAMQGVELMCLGVSSAGVRWAAQAIGPFVRPEIPIISVTKGLEQSQPGTLRVLPHVLRDLLLAQQIEPPAPAAIGGPCIAGELARRVPTSVVFTGDDGAILDRLAREFRTPYYHIRTSTDVVGVEVCAALKNAYAMAVGIGAGVHERAGLPPGPVAHHNYESAIFAQACLEMTVLVRALAGQSSQVPHLPGAGDLMVTCSGGRSSRLGRLLGLGLSFEQARAQMSGETLESADTVRVVGGALDAMERQGLIAPASMPLMRHLYEVIVLGRELAMPFEQFFW